MTSRARLDVVVIGAGPAGLAAADAAAGSGGDVLLLDQGAHPGGQIWRHRPGDALPSVAQRLMRAVRPPRVSIASRATVIDAHDPHALVVSFNGRVAVVETSNVVVATGAVERFLPFPGWTTPGVVGIGALQALVKNGLRVVGAKVVLAGAGPLSLPVAATLAKSEADVLMIAEQASGRAVRKFGAAVFRDPFKLWQFMNLRLASWKSRYHTDSWPLRAISSSQGTLEGVVMLINGKESEIRCDWLATNAGLVPRTQVGQLLGCEIRDGALSVDEGQQTSVPHVFAAGECTGIGGDEGARLEGTIAGMMAAGMEEIPAALLRSRDRSRRFGARLSATFAPRAELNSRPEPDTILCRCEDVRYDSVGPEWTQRQAKLWTRVGMGACQGTICGPACESLFGWHSNSVRPPLEQLPIGAWCRGLSEPDL